LEKSEWGRGFCWRSFLGEGIISDRTRSAGLPIKGQYKCHTLRKKRDASLGKIKSEVGKIPPEAYKEKKEEASDY